MSEEMTEEEKRFYEVAEEMAKAMIEERKEQIEGRIAALQSELGGLDLMNAEKMAKAAIERRRLRKKIE